MTINPQQAQEHTPWLFRPYPLIVGQRRKTTVAIAFGLFIYLFLLLFQPFGIRDVKLSLALYALGYGMITSVVMYTTYTLLPILSPSLFHPDNWTVLKNILLGIWIMSWIAILNFFYTSYMSGLALDPSLLAFFLLGTLAIGAFPLTILIFVTELYLTGKHEKTAADVNAQMHPIEHVSPPGERQSIEISGSTGGDYLKLFEDELLFIKSEDNYCSIHFILDNNVNSKLIRVTLKNIESQLKTRSQYIRCHRSYIINKDRVAAINGNARAYYLQLNNIQEKIPVSRSFEVKTLLL